MLHPLSNIEVTKCFNYKPRCNGIYWDSLPRIKNGAYVINLNDKIVKEPVGFHYLLTEIQPCTLILLELNMFLKKY